MDLFTAIILIAFSLGVILLITSLVFLERHDRTKSVLGDKWGIWAVIAMGLAMLSCLVIYLIFYGAGLVIWGSDY